jgi:hypothetical protein
MKILFLAASFLLVSAPVAAETPQQILASLSAAGRQRFGGAR